MRSFRSWIAVGVALATVIVVVVVAVVNWSSVDGADISLNGWIALVLGVLATLGVGVGLMSLVFISSRGGYDDPPEKDR